MLSENKVLRSNARAQLKGNWGVPILVYFLYILISVVLAIIPIIGSIMQILIIGAFLLGLTIFSLKFKRGEKPEFTTLFEGFKYYGTSLGIYLWVGLWTFLWSLLLIIPGIIKAISYSMSIYIIADNPKIGVRNALNISKKITNGYKSKIFMLTLSFFGWGVLSVLTLGIGYLWLTPYIQITLANLFDELKNDSIERGICSAEEFPSSKTIIMNHQEELTPSL